MSIELTPERALELLREVVAEHGEDTTAGCMYVDEGVPHCIAGEAYFRAGVTAAQLLAAEGSNADSPKFILDFGVPRQAAEVVACAQSVQDNGDTWGEALAAAEEYYIRNLAH